MFLFSSIPASLLFDSYIETRSKYILLGRNQNAALPHPGLHLPRRTQLRDQHPNRGRLSPLPLRTPSQLRRCHHRTLPQNQRRWKLLSGNSSLTQHVLEFIRIGRILQENPYLKPSALDRVPLWLPLKRALARNCPSCPSLSSPAINLILSLAALIGAIIGVACLFSDA